jgi:hypothetical protein
VENVEGILNMGGVTERRLPRKANAALRTKAQT